MVKNVQAILSIVPFKQHRCFLAIDLAFQPNRDGKDGTTRISIEIGICIQPKVLSFDGSTLGRVIQQVSGHRNLQHVQNYIEVREEQVLGAVSALSILSPVEENVGKWTKPYLSG